MIIKPENVTPAIPLLIEIMAGPSCIERMESDISSGKIYQTERQVRMNKIPDTK
jgi:hypothetical protein